MRGTAIATLPVICSAGICLRDIRTAHSIHRAAAVTAEDMSRVYIIIFSYPMIAVVGTFLYLRLYQRKSAVVYDRLMVVLNNDVVSLLQFNIIAVYFFTAVLALTKSADIEIISEYGTDSDNTPGIL